VSSLGGALSLSMVAVARTAAVIPTLAAWSDVGYPTYSVSRSAGRDWLLTLRNCH